MRLGLVALVALVIAASALASPPRATVSLRSTPLGRVLVDSRGHTLYLFDEDTRRTSACAGACAAAWPPLLTTGKPLAARGLRASLLGTIKRTDGSVQVTFAGHPLYRFAEDARPGQVGGAAVAHWAALSATGAKVRAQSAAAPPPPSTTPPPPDYGGGGGYGGYP